MTEPVLTDEEKSALLDGVASGAVEVHTAAGQKYADVRPHAIAGSSRIRSHSYPHLQVLDQQVAERLGRQIEKTLHSEISVAAEEVSQGPFSQFCRAFEAAPAVIAFGAPPLKGRALLVIEAATIGRLVEGFYGGGHDPAAATVVAFTPGEISVCRLFGNAVLAAVAEVWKSLVPIKPEPVAPVVGLELADAIGETDSVIGTRFEIRFAEGTGTFSLTWPLAMVSGLLRQFEGQKRDRDPAAEARWEKAMRARLPDVVVRLEAIVGQADKQLGELTGLKPGDVIEIANPQAAVLRAGQFGALHGRFGVLGGRNAIETTGWTPSDPSE